MKHAYAWAARADQLDDWRPEYSRKAIVRGFQEFPGAGYPTSFAGDTVEPTVIDMVAREPLRPVAEAWADEGALHFVADLTDAWCALVEWEDQFHVRPPRLRALAIRALLCLGLPVREAHRELRIRDANELRPLLEEGLEFCYLFLRGRWVETGVISVPRHAVYGLETLWGELSRDVTAQPARGRAA